MGRNGPSLSIFLLHVPLRRRCTRPLVEGTTCHWSLQTIHLGELANQSYLKVCVCVCVHVCKTNYTTHIQIYKVW